MTDAADTSAATSGYDPYNSSTRLPRLDTIQPEFECATCHEEIALGRGFGDCEKCTAAILIHGPHAAHCLSEMRRWYGGTPWMNSLEREIDRQMGALVACGRSVA